MRVFEYFFQVTAPHDCLLCGVEGRLVCDECERASFTRLPERCYRCYRLSPENKTCPVCRHHSVLKNTWVRTIYDEPARKLIHALKFTHAKDAAAVIAAGIYTTLPELDPETVITHVPSATSHVRKRGYDQSALIARELSRLTGHRHINTLARLGQQRQVGATRVTRQQQMVGAFRPIATSVILSLPILLIDDVLTTGSTLEVAGLSLKQAGAQTVSAAVFATAR